MTARILAGAPAATAVLAEASRRAANLPVRPHLVMIRVGGDQASLSYVRGKQRQAEMAGLRSTVHALPESVTLPELLVLVQALNADRDVHGVLIQLPLPAHLSVAPLQEAVDPRKDVDGFHPLNVGRLWAGSTSSDHPVLAPCTPVGVLALLRYYEIPVAGRRAVIVGRSDIVGRPMAALLLGADATVTVAHRQTADLRAVTREADVLIVAAGQPWLITAEMVRPGAAVVDVGIHRVPGQGQRLHLTGDVHPEVVTVAGALTPVPGGVGPLTVAQLMLNTVIAAERQVDWTVV